MAIKWLDAKRLQGTNAERLALTINGGTDATNSGATQVTSPSGLSALGTYSWEFDENTPSFLTIPYDLTNYASFTVSFWIHPNHASGVTHGEHIWRNGASGSDLIVMNFYNYTEGNFQFNVGSSAQVFIDTISDNTWVHITCVKDGDNIAVYKNGAAGGGSPDTDTGAGSGAHAGSGTFYIGKWSGGEAIDGDLKQFLLYDAALPRLGETNSVEAIYKDGLGTTTPPTDNLLVNYNFQQADSSALTNQATTHPNLPNGTIFNELDTYKYFMWNGTDTWNQMVSS